MALKLESAKRLAKYHWQKQPEADEVSKLKSKSAEAGTIENQEVCESQPVQETGRELLQGRIIWCTGFAERYRKNVVPLVWKMLRLVVTISGH